MREGGLAGGAEDLLLNSTTTTPTVVLPLVLQALVLVLGPMARLGQ